MALETLMPNQAAEVEQLPPAVDRQRITQMAPNVEYVRNRQELFLEQDFTQQTSASQYVAAGSSTSSIGRSMPAGNGTARYLRKREDEDRHGRFRSAPLLTEDNKFRTGSQEYRNGKEERFKSIH